MPQIYRYLGLIFYFWSDDHLPVHVHVTDETRTKECIFDLVIENSVLVEIRVRTDTKPPLKTEDTNKAKAFINTYYPQIIKKWFQYYVCGEPLKSVTIRKKVSDEIEIENIINHLEELKNKFYFSKKKHPKKEETKRKNGKGNK